MKNSIIMHERTSSRWRNCIFWKPYGDAGLDISFCSHSMSNFMWALRVYLAQEYPLAELPHVPAKDVYFESFVFGSR